MFDTLILSAVAMTLIVAAAYDLTTMTIPNWLSLALVGLFPLAASLSGIGLTDMALHFGVGVAALAIGIAIFAAGYAGGGDAKLFAAGALYMGLTGIGPFLMAVAISGGVLVLVLLALRRIPLPLNITSLPWVARLYHKGQGVPYGVAIAIGALMVLPQTHIATGLSV